MMLELPNCMSREVRPWRSIYGLSDCAACLTGNNFAGKFIGIEIPATLKHNGFPTSSGLIVSHIAGCPFQIIIPKAFRLITYLCWLDNGTVLPRASTLLITVHAFLLLTFCPFLISAAVSSKSLLVNDAKFSLILGHDFRFAMRLAPPALNHRTWMLKARNINQGCLAKRRLW